MKKVSKRWTPAHWASWKPYGVGEQRPNNYQEILRTVWENRDQLPYAWRILTQGVCDGCALGTAGLRDWTHEGIHLCNVRLRLLRLNTMPALDIARLQEVAQLAARSGRELRQLGRLAQPMIRGRDEPGFRPIAWDEALAEIAGRISASRPERLGFYLTSRGMPNESYYAAQKAVRALGTNSIDNAARVCHSPSTDGLKTSLGVAATTCSYEDWIGSDLVVFIGCNVANNQPVATKFLHYAKKEGTRIVVVNPYREPGMERYWIPSIPESAIFGTRLADHFFQVNVGGDIGFLNGTMKHMVEEGWLDQSFIETHTAGFEALRAELDRQSWDDLERISGATRAEMLSFARMVGEAETAVFVWAMGITQHAFGERNVQAIVNLALTRGFVGRPGSGLMPIRGHSGVQGGSEMGAYATVFPGGLPVNAENAAVLSARYGFAVSPEPGFTAPQMIDAAHAGQLDVLFAAGGNFLDVLPQPEYVQAGLERVPLRVHMDIVLSRQMLLDPAEVVILLPAATRYEIPGGVTQTSTERRVIFNPEIEGPRPGDVRSEGEVLLEIARRVRPELSPTLSFTDMAAVRREIGQIIPMYDGIQNLTSAGDQFQYGGAHLCWNWNFPTPDGKAHFVPVQLPLNEVPEGAFVVTTRRGKQFNSIVQERKDALNGALREAVLINPVDAERLGLKNGDRVELRNGVGALRGHAMLAPIQPGNLQVHWPEGNVLIDRRVRSPGVGIPDYNAVVRLERVAASREEA